MTLLNRCQLDDDDEVRDRATMYVNILQKQMTLDAASEESSAKNTAEMALITDGLPEGVSVRGLEDAIVAYQMLPPSDVPITLDTLPIVLGTPEHQETADDNDADAIINDGEEDTYEDENSDLSNKQNQMVSKYKAKERASRTRALSSRFLFHLPLSNLFHCLCHGLLYLKYPNKSFLT